MDPGLFNQVREGLEIQSRQAVKNQEWLFAHMHPYFFITMREEAEAMVTLAARLHEVAHHRKITLVDQERKLLVACLDIPGSLYDTLKTLSERETSYAEISHSYEPIPGVGRNLEVQRFEFERKAPGQISGVKKPGIPTGIGRPILDEMRSLYPGFDFREFDDVLDMLWLNNDTYVRISPPERIARVMRLYQQGRRHNGLFLDVERKETGSGQPESRLMFSVGNPPQKGFLTQLSEILQRLDIGVRRSYSLIIDTGVHPYFLGNFYVVKRDGTLVEGGSALFDRLKTEFYNTQILSTSTSAYTDFLMPHVMTGEEASLTNAFISFCHTSLAHCEPDRFDAEVVKEAFHAEPEITLKLIGAFRKRFDPNAGERAGEKGDEALMAVRDLVEAYNTGHRHLDEIRRKVYLACLSFIRHTLKTNFFVPEKHALAFRLAPAVLADLGEEATSDLPRAVPFRITFFFTRQGTGYHVGFSDIARGGWRTVICRTPDELATNTSNLFREVFVLAHTQHLKNKDIYEGGSKLTVVLDATDLHSPMQVTQRLYKVQYGVLNAFLDIFVTTRGKATHPRVVDYYGEDEPIEIGPDENMHDGMIELMARQSVKRGYVLGIGIISSKQVGINHREYGVTSRGVVKAAEIAMRHVGLDIYRDPFRVKFTGGPNGDVAGNSMRLLLDRCPRAKICCIVDGTAGLHDPAGVTGKALRRLLLKHDLDRFDPNALHVGASMLFREHRRKEGLRELYRKVSCTESGIEETWVTTDEFHREIEEFLFTVQAHLFLPCGGRPETIDGGNWQRLFDKDGSPNVPVIVEGANSFLTPDARKELQKRGIVLIRDASANKCGVISSSYEIIANLLMSEEEFLANKEVYVSDVIRILEKRAEEETSLIFRRYQEGKGQILFGDISLAISEEINEHYSRLFNFFQSRPKLVREPPFRRLLLEHLPECIRKHPRLRSRVKGLPVKIQYAILASEISTRIVYHEGWEMDFEARIREYAKKQTSVDLRKTLR